MSFAPFVVLITACSTGYAAYSLLDRLPIN